MGDFLMTTPKRPAPALSQAELEKEILGIGDAVVLRRLFCNAVDRKLDEIERDGGATIRNLLTDELAVQFILEGKVVAPEGEITAIVRRNISEAIKSGAITSVEDGELYIGIYAKMVTNHLDRIIADKEKFKQNPNLINSVLEQMKQEVMQPVTAIIETNNKIQGIKENLMAPPPLGIIVFHPTTHQAMVEAKLEHPNPTALMQHIQEIRNNMAKKLSQEASAQGLSDQLANANQYDRLNKLIDASLAILNSYQAKQPVNAAKLRALAALANSLNDICSLPENVITSENITQMSNKLHQELLNTYDNILIAEKGKGLVSGMMAKASSSTLRNITKAIQEDKEHVAASAKEKPEDKSVMEMKKSSTFLRKA